MKNPLHKKIEMDILKKIESGEYPLNELIPTEMELADSYDVSRPTIRQAIQSLVNAGYLEKRRKRGTIVKQPKIEQEFTRSIESFNSELYRKGLFPQTQVLSFTKTKATKDVAKNLELNVDTPVYKLTRLRFAKDQPVVFVTSFIPCEMFPHLNEIDFSQQSLYKTFEQMGKPVCSARRKLEIASADETLSHLLDISENDPLFLFSTQGFTAEKIPIEYSIAKYRSDINHFIFEVSV